MQIIKKRNHGFETKKAWYGFCFTIPWIIGLIIFFVIPLFKSLSYAFSELSIGDHGDMISTFIGFDNFNYAFTIDPDFVNNLIESISDFLFSFPIVLVLSLIFAILLNQKFYGRTFVRGVFFLPVIIATGIVMQMMSSSVSGQPAMQGMGETGAYAVSAIDFGAILKNLDLPTTVVSLIEEYVNRVFDIVWRTGVQVTLFVSGMQTIPDQLYEVSKIEGASKWEEFWFVTIPLLKDIILLVMFYTMVDLLISVSNPAISQAYAFINSIQYGLSSAMLWSYMTGAMAISGIILLAYKKFCMDRW